MKNCAMQTCDEDESERLYVADITEAEVTSAASAARRESRANSRRRPSIGVLVNIQARIAAGQATHEEREWARRSLIQYRTRYREGNLSPVTALRLGLIDAEGKELDCKIGKG
jgi:hypothetical protein